MKDIMLMMHFLGLAMGLGTSFGFMFLGIASKKMEAAEGRKFMMNASALSTMGHIGLGLLFLSGGYLMTPHWSSLADRPLLMAKLTLFLVLGALIGMLSGNVRRAKKGDAEMYMKKNELLGKIAMLVGVAIVVLAVLNFH